MRTRLLSSHHQHTHSSHPVYLVFSQDQYLVWTYVYLMLFTFELCFAAIPLDCRVKHLHLRSTSGLENILAVTWGFGEDSYSPLTTPDCAHCRSGYPVWCRRLVAEDHIAAPDGVISFLFQREPADGPMVNSRAISS